MDIKGTVALVTGGGIGAGAATAKRLFDAGASVVLVDLPQSAGDAYAAELNATRSGEGGSRVHMLSLLPQTSPTNPKSRPPSMPP